MPQEQAIAANAPSRLHLTVGIATRGRSRILADTLADLSRQSRLPDRIVVSYPEPADVAGAEQASPLPVLFLKSAPGLTTQRNAILAALPDSDIVIFLDDDFYLDPQYLALVEAAFLARPDVVAATGRVLADGINGPGLDLAQAQAALNAPPAPPPAQPLTPVFNAYGCNMCLRLAPIREQQLLFDQKLPLYGWYEDVDFCRRLAPFGAIVRVEQALGVHLGAKSGRQSGLRLGYSQVANPIYLARKRSVPWRFAIASMLSRSLKNLVYSANSEPFVDRRGRLRGNLLAWKELLTGSISPLRILEM